MDASQIPRIRGAGGMKFLCGVVIFFTTAASFCEAAELWRTKLAPENPGPFPLVKPFDGEFRFGWLDLEAGRAKVKLTDEGDAVRMQVEGGSTGMARALWKIDATHTATILKSGLQSRAFDQVEKYAKKTVTTQAVFQPDGLWRQRDVVPDPNGPAKWKRIKITPIRDIIAAMFFIRSQPLANTDRVGVIAFPGDASYLVEVEVAGREMIAIAGKSWPSIKLTFQISTIVKADKKENKLEPHKKFRNGTVWISDDENRIPLRAEVNIFIGYVFGELEKVSFP